MSYFTTRFLFPRTKFLLQFRSWKDSLRQKSGNRDKEIETGEEGSYGFSIASTFAIMGVGCKKCRV